METIRLINSCDYDQIIIHLNEWWGGRKMTDMLPRLFFNHFKNTCYIIESNDKIKGFIIGFISQVDSTLGYVHFIGVNPEFRKEGLGKILYFTLFRRFYDLGVKEVECVTSTSNDLSISFHQRIGFTIKKGDDINENGISYIKNYDGPDEDRVIFNIKLSDHITASRVEQHHLPLSL